MVTPPAQQPKLLIVKPIMHVGSSDASSGRSQLWNHGPDATNNVKKQWIDGGGGKSALRQVNRVLSLYFIQSSVWRSVVCCFLNRSNQRETLWRIIAG